MNTTQGMNLQLAMLNPDEYSFLRNKFEFDAIGLKNV